MDIGSGLVVSTLICVAAWQIEKRSAWRKFSKGVAYGAGLLLLLVGVGAGVIYAKQKGDESERESRYNEAAERIKSGQLQELAGIELGSNVEAVKYLWGTPTTSGEQLLEWKDGSTQRDIMLRSDNKLVGGIFCGTLDYPFRSGCGELAGISLGSSEDEVIRRLGSPSSPATYDRGEKVLEYGTKNRTLNIGLRKGEVVRFALIDWPAKIEPASPN